MDKWYNADDPSSEGVLPPDGAPTPAPSWGDYAKQPVIGATSLISGLKSGSSYLNDKLGNVDEAQLQALQAHDWRDTTQGIEDSMTPGGKSVMDGSLMDHPLRGGAMRLLQMAPAVAATALPGGVIADVLGGGAGAVAAGGINAAISGGQFADQVASRIDSVPDDELRKQSPLYDGLRNSMSKQDALDAYRDHLMDGSGRTALVLLGGALGGGLGIGGKLAEGASGRVLGSAAEAGLAGGAQAGSSDYAYQQAMVDGGFQNHVDASEWAKQVFENMGIGTLTAGAHALTAHGSAQNYPKAGDDAKPGLKPTTTPDATTPGPAEAAALNEVLNAKNPPSDPPKPPAPTPTAEGKPPAPEPPQATQAPVQPTAPVQGEAPNVPAPTKAAAPPTDAPVPTPPATSDAALQKLTNGEVSAVVFKPGETIPTRPDGFKQTKIGPDVYFYNPGQLTAGGVTKAVRDGTIGQHLGLTDVSKDEAIARTQQGEQPVGVVERTPDGTEVKAAAGTDQTAPSQVGQMEANKTPGNTVQVETPAKVIQARLAGGEAPAPTTGPMNDAERFSPTETSAAAAAPATKPVTPEMRQAAEEAAARINASLPGKRVLADVSDQGIAKGALAQEQQNATQDAAINRATKIDAKVEKANNPISVGRKDMTDAKLVARQKLNEVAKRIVEANPPGPTEDKVVAEGGEGRVARLDMRTRAKAMLAQLAEEKQELPGSVKDNKNPEHNYSEHVALLKMARKIASGSAKISEYGEFQNSEKLARSGNRADLLGLKRMDQDTKFGGLGSKGMEGTPDQKAAEEPEVEEPHVTAADTNTRYDGEPTHDEAAPGGISATVAAESADHENEPDDQPDHGITATNRAIAGALAKQDAETKAHLEARKSEEIPKIGMKTAPVVTLKSRRVPVSAKIAKLQVGDDWTVPVGGKGGTLPVIGTGKLSNFLGGIAGDKTGWQKEDNFTSAMVPYLARRLTAIVGDMDVHVVAQHEIDAMFPGKNIDGFYDPKYNHIVLSADIPQGAETHVILHEALHGALYHAIENNPQAKADIRALMNEFKANNADLGDQYAYTNEHEFVSEILTNPDLRDTALATPLSKPLAARLALAGKLANFWDGILAGFRRALGFSPNYTSVLDGVVSVADRLGLGREPGAAEGSASPERSRAASQGVAPITRQASDPVGTATAREKLLSSVSENVGKAMSTMGEAGRKYGPKFLSNDQYRQTIEHLFGPADESNDVRRLVDGIEKANTMRKKLLAPADELAGKLWKASKQYEGEDWQRFSKLINDSTMHNVNPDAALDSDANSHLRLAKDNNGDESEGSMANWQSRAKHEQLSADYASLPKELQELYQQSRDYFSDERNARVEQHVRAILDPYDAPEGSTKEDAIQRVLNGNMTDADEAHYNKIMHDTDSGDTEPKDGQDPKSKQFGKVLRTAEDMQKTQGPYFPLKRRGDYVVVGDHDVPMPANAKRISDTEMEFPTRDAAHDYVANSDLPATARTVHYDPETGELTSKGNISTAGNPREAYRVRVQNQHVEFADTQARAEETRQAMLDAGVKNVRDVDKVDRNRSMDYGLKSGQLTQLEKAVRRRDDLSANEKERLVQSLRESAVGLQRGNRLESTFLRRKNVAGASTDVINNLTDYAHASAAFRSRAEFKKDIDGSLSAMRKTTDESKPGENRLGRREAVQEYERRLEGFGSPEYQGKLGPVWTRLMQLSFIKRMLSPAHLALHLTHPMMVSAPLMAGRYGVKAYRELSRAYNDLGGRGALAEGVKGMAQNWRANGQATDFGNYFRKQLKGFSDYDNLNLMMEELEATGHIHPDAGFDVSRYAENKTGYDRGMDKVDRAFRELTSATEGVNRYATAVAAYRLADKEGLTHAQGVRYAKDTVANSQGLYSQTNAAPIFRGQARPFLQFKQMPATLIHLMGKLIINGFRGETPEIRKQALRSFGTMMGAAALMSGVGGLPQDAAKAVFAVGEGLGVTPDWETEEANMRVGLAHELGPEMAKLVMGGITGMGPQGVNVGHRMGYASLLTFGEPSSGKTDDVKSYIADQILGAPRSMLMDTYDGLRHLRNGEFTQAAAKLAPAKFIGDIIKAADDYNGGKPNVGMPPVGAIQAAVQAFGFEPREVQDYMDASHAARNQIKEEPKKPRLGPKGQAILGITSKRNRGLLNDYTNSYGLGQ